MSLNAARMDELADNKKYTIAVALIVTQLAKGYDDLAEMFIKIVSKSHTNARNALKDVREKNGEKTDQLVDTLHKILIASSEQDSTLDFGESVQKIIEGQEDNLLKACEEHAVYAGNNYIPFVWRFHSSKRKAMFEILETISLVSTTQDSALAEAINCLMEYKSSRKKSISILKADSENNELAFDLSCVPEGWGKAVFGNKNKLGITEVDRHNFELCVFHQIKEGLKTGDLCIEGSDNFSDYRT